MKEDMNVLVGYACNKYLNSFVPKYTNEDANTIRSMNKLHRECIDYISVNNVNSIQDIPSKFHEILKLIQ
jgi:hypothetical protein